MLTPKPQQYSEETRNSKVVSMASSSFQSKSLEKNRQRQEVLVVHNHIDERCKNENDDDEVFKQYGSDN